MQAEFARADAMNGKICVLPQTDIQCAPCSTSDKLIVRVATITKGQACPAGSTEVGPPPSASNMKK
jgi:hypothetical protein